MISSTAGNSLTATHPALVAPGPAAFITRKLWIPKALYDALPWFYLFAGVLSFLATLYVGDWFWILPHYLLFSVACCHLGFIVLRRRNRSRSERLAGD